MPTPRRQRAEANGTTPPAKGERRRKLLACAKQLFATQGYTATSLEQIAAAVGLTPAQAARSFADRPAYLKAVIPDLLALAFPAAPNGAAGEAPPDALAQLHAAVDRLLLAARLELRVFLRVLAEPDLDAESAAVAEAGLAELIEALTKLTQEGQQAGVLRRSPDARTAAAEIFRALLGYVLVQPYFRPDPPPTADAGTRALDGLLHGLLKTDV
jgi:AcrR family transcriptional regulator